MSRTKKLIVCLLIIGMASVAAVIPHSTFAKPSSQDKAKKENVVYATKRGKKYHLKTCPFIRKRETTAMSKEEAEDKGLAPCGRCIGQDE